MFEIVFIIGLLTWLVDLLCEYLYPLAVFPTLLTAVLTIPALTFFDYHLALGRQFLTGVEQDRDPVPPEVFRWHLVRPRWKKQIITCALLLPMSWLPIFWFPARLELSLDSVIGWICGSIAIFSTAILLSRITLYFRIAQWFDEMTPRIAGWFWNMMYRISGNHDYLPEKREPEPEKVIF